MKSLLYLAITLATLGYVSAAHAQTRLDLNIPALKVVVYEDDEAVKTYPVAVGMPGFDTPTGKFAITHAEWNPSWTPPDREWARNDRPTPPGPNNPMGRVKLFFMPLYFFHGTPEGESIGTPASHGCVRMRNTDVIELSRYLHQRAAPQVTPAQINRILANPSRTRAVNLSPDIDVTIRYDLVAVEGSEILVYPDIYKYNTVHTEGVYQALITAGYDVSNLELSAVRRFVEATRGKRAPVVMKLDEAFGGELRLAQR